MSETMMILKAQLEVFNSVLSPSTPTVGLMETGPHWDSDLLSHATVVQDHTLYAPLTAESSWICCVKWSEENPPFFCWILFFLFKVEKLTCLTWEQLFHYESTHSPTAGLRVSVTPRGLLPSTLQSVQTTHIHATEALKQSNSCWVLLCTSLQI